MVDLESLGWRTSLVGELDHHRLKAPSIKLRSARRGSAGDAIFCVDLRVRRPNTDSCLSSAVAHSLEHFLLEGLQRLLPDQFVSIAPMGCRTGFYIVLLNEGRASVICATLRQILEAMQEAPAVPYANARQCGNWSDHDLQGARAVAREVLAQRDSWLDAA